MNNDFVIGLTYADRLRLATENRHQAIRSIFETEVLPLTSLMGPMSDGPEWPASPAWLAAWHGNNACVFSDGLSDPWVERNKPESGLGLEVFIESPDVVLSDKQPLPSIIDTWLFPMVAEISHTLAGHPKLCEKLCNGQITSLEFNIEHIKDGRGRVGVLLNIPYNFSQNISLPGGEVRLVAATLLTVAELKFLRGKGDAGRHELAKKLSSANIGHLSLLHRPSLY